MTRLANEKAKVRPTYLLKGTATLSAVLFATPSAGTIALPTNLVSMTWQRPEISGEKIGGGEVVPVQDGGSNGSSVSSDADFSGVTTAFGGCSSTVTIYLSQTNHLGSINATCQNGDTDIYTLQGAFSPASSNWDGYIVAELRIPDGGPPQPTTLNLPVHLWISPDLCEAQGWIDQAYALNVKSTNSKC